MAGTSIVCNPFELNCEMRYVSSLIDRKVIILPCDDQMEFTQAWREKTSSALTNEEWDHTWKLFVHANNPWGQGLAGYPEAGRRWALCQVTRILIFYLSVSLSLQTQMSGELEFLSYLKQKFWNEIVKVVVVLVRSFILSEKIQTMRDKNALIFEPFAGYLVWPSKQETYEYSAERPLNAKCQYCSIVKNYIQNRSKNTV